MSKPPIHQALRNRSPSPVLRYNQRAIHSDICDGTVQQTRPISSPHASRTSSNQSRSRPSTLTIHESTNQNSQSQTSPGVAYGTPKRSSSQPSVPHSPQARSPSPGLIPPSPRSPSPNVTQQVQRIRSTTPSLLEQLLRRTRSSWGG
jgi:hypothetical protein